MKMVIICGGVGTKMWPESRRKMPKHFLQIIDGKSLFQINWEVLRKKFEPKDIYLQTQAYQAEIAKDQVKEILSENVFIEPEMKNQGPATGLAAALLYRIAPDEPFMLVQVDDIRVPEVSWLKMIDVCDSLARKTTKYITGGFKPDFAITGNDWLIKGDKIEDTDDVGVYKVGKFLWRGGGEEAKKQAEEYLADGKALLHTNHTCMTPRNFLEMFKKYRDDWYQPLMNIGNGGDVAVEFAKMPPGPLEDVTQHVHEAGETLVVELPFKWNDIGTWESLVNYESAIDSKINGDVVEVGGQNNYVRSKKLVAFVGVENLVVVETADAILICKKDQSGRVGEVVEKLKEKGREELV